MEIGGKFVFMVDQEYLSKFLPTLEGTVFHATTLEAYNNIRSQGFIVPNSEGLYSSPFGNYDGYFKKRGCVSFFDYRNTKGVEEQVYKCLPTNAFEHSTALVILQLSPDCYGNLVSWEGWKLEGAYSEQIIPYIETGIKGRVAISNIVSAS